MIRRLADERGFALLLVLLITGLVATVALLVTSDVRLSLKDVATAHRLSALRAAADGGASRVTAYLLDAENPSSRLLFEGKSITERVGAMDVELSLVDERRKADINTSSVETLGSILRDADLMAQIEKARASDVVLAGVGQLLPRCARLSATSAALQKAATTLTRGSGEQFADGLNAGIAIYRLMAKAQDGNGATLTREKVLLLRTEAPYVTVLMSADAAPQSDQDFCG